MNNYHIYLDEILFPPFFFLEDGFPATFDVTSLPVETLEFS